LFDAPDDNGDQPGSLLSRISRGSIAIHCLLSARALRQILIRLIKRPDEIVVVEPTFSASRTAGIGSRIEARACRLEDAGNGIVVIT
jgi:hypothetical protein